jgi:hypothetical protein
MKPNTLRNLLGAVLALTLTVLTTQTIVHATPRPYSAVAPQILATQSGPSAGVAPCAGYRRALC